MDKTDFFYNLRRKKDKTLEEKLLLEYRKRLITISEYLVSYSKCEICEYSLVKNIKKILNVNDL
ncbi:TPA: hypothetical protein I9089_002496 [Clostridium perfringens]|nr:hypothetical protein [Clostridium perfringens]